MKSIYKQYGMTFVETLVAATILAALAIGTTYFLAQNRATLSSSSQATQCQTIVKQALEKVTSLGARLYGYKINDPDLGYAPLFIKKSGSNIIDTGDGSELKKFPPDYYTGLFKALGANPSQVNPKDNSGVPIISSNSSQEVEIGTSVMMINSVNAMQYLYNSDSGYATDNGGKGKIMTLNDEFMSKMLKKYKDRFDLEDVKFYLKISPIDLEDNTPISPHNVKCQKIEYKHNGTKYSIIPTTYSCLNAKVLTRPRFSEIPSDTHIKKDGREMVTENVKIIGNPDIGFEMKVTFEYKYDEQSFSCDTIHRFTHQIKPIIEKSPKEDLDVNIKKIENGAGVDLTRPDRFNTSCDTDGSGYDDIKMTLDFTGITESQQAGTVILCQMNSYCRSFGDDGGYSGCTPTIGLWQRCHQIKPTGSDQSWTLKSKLISDLVLELTFEDMKSNRRYDLNVGEFSLAGNLISRKNLSLNPKFVFYLDDTRPTIGKRRIMFDTVGYPTDNKRGRNYDPNRPTNWKVPLYSTKKWLQCQKDNVHFQAEVKDQFRHNLTYCRPPHGGIEGIRKDGNGQTKINISNECLSPKYWTTVNGERVCVSPNDPNGISGERCEKLVKQQHIEHGRHTITFTPGDTCGTGTSEKIAWDVDLPNTFEAQSFPKAEYWFRSLQGPGYSIQTVVPAKTPAGKFPKHYTVDCDQNYINNKTRDDGNSKRLTCTLETSFSHQDDGCNPELMGAKYYHVCGGITQCKQTQWAVYVPDGKNCKNVQCEPNLICCNDPTNGDCGYVSHQHCAQDKYPKSCSNPKCGGQDLTCGCPPLGLYSCSYDCTCSNNGRGSCDGKRDGDDCSVTVFDGYDSQNNPIYRNIPGTCDMGQGGCSRKGVGGKIFHNEKCKERKPVCFPLGTPPPPPPSPPPPPPLCSDPAEYSTQQLCDKERGPLEECYQDGNCWKRRKVCITGSRPGVCLHGAKLLEDTRYMMIHREWVHQNRYNCRVCHWDWHCKTASGLYTIRCTSDRAIPEDRSRQQCESSAGWPDWPFDSARSRQKDRPLQNPKYPYICNY